MSTFEVFVERPCGHDLHIHFATAYAMSETDVLRRFEVEKSVPCKHCAAEAEQETKKRFSSYDIFLKRDKEPAVRRDAIISRLKSEIKFTHRRSDCNRIARFVDLAATLRDLEKKTKRCTSHEELEIVYLRWCELAKIHGFTP